MFRRPNFPPIVAAAVVATTAAAASAIITSSLLLGPGRAIAQWSEVWVQWLLPGTQRVDIVDPAWKTESEIVGSGYISFQSYLPTLGPTDYVPYFSSITILGLVGGLLHLCFCGMLCRWRAEKPIPSPFTSEATSVWSDPAVRASICRRSALLAAFIAPLWLALLFMWAGADRGSLTQRIVGGYYAPVALGPFGRFCMLLGAVMLYPATIFWSARLAAMRAVKTRTSTSHCVQCGHGSVPGTICPECGLSPNSTIKPETNRWVGTGLLAPIILTTLAIVLLLLPGWGYQTARILGQDTINRIELWSISPSVRTSIESLAPRFP